MTLADLAAMAAKHVPHFVRPTRCKYPHGRLREFDDSPDELHLAAYRAASESVRERVFAERGRFDANEEQTRALLTALLRAHGVEVADA